MSKLPTLIFIHGSWHTAACWDKLFSPLRDDYKLRCVAVALPSTSGNPAATFKDDLDVACEAISNETAQGRDVVLIAHSYGGMVANSSIRGFSRPKDTVESASNGPQSSDKGYVIGLILIASGFTLTGLSFMDPFFGRPPPAWRVNNETGYAELVVDPREFFYHDLPREEGEFWVSQLTTQSLKALFEGGEHAYGGWLDVPSWYIGTVEDHGLPVLVQRMGVGAAREMGAVVEHRELQTSHSPFLSQPEETINIILDAVQAFTGKSIDSQSQIQVKERILLPAPNIWKPLTWLRFGLPLAFGHLVGRSFLIFSGIRRLFNSR